MINDPSIMTTKELLDLRARVDQLLGGAPESRSVEVVDFPLGYPRTFEAGLSYITNERPVYKFVGLTDSKMTDYAREWTKAVSPLRDLVEDMDNVLRDPSMSNSTLHDEIANWRDEITRIVG